MAGNRVTFFHQANDTIRFDIGNRLDDDSLLNLAATNSRLCDLLLPILMARLQTLIVQKKLDRVTALLDQAPWLLLKTGEVQIRTYAGAEYVNMTPLQVARAEGDTETCQRIVTYFFDRLPNGTEVAENQLENFTSELTDQHHTYDFSVLVDAITHNNNVDAALEKCRSDFDAMVKTNGFPFQALHDAAKTYDANFDLWSVNQRQQFSINVIGYLQRLSPPWLRQVYAEGLRWVVEGNISSCDNYRVRDDLYIDPDQDVPGKGLGYEYCVNVMGVDDQKEIDYNFRSPDCATFAELLEKLFATKKIELLDLTNDQRFNWEDLMRCL